MVWMVLYIIEVIKYSMAYYVCFNRNVKNFWVALLGGVTYFFVVILNILSNISLIHIIMSFTVLGVTFFMMEESWKKRPVQLLILFFILSSLEESINILVEIFKISTDNEISLVVEYLITSVLNLLLFCLLTLWKKRGGRKQMVRLKIFFGKNILIFTLLMSIGMLFTVAGLNYARSYANNIGFQIMALAVCAISYISICLLGIFTIYIKQTSDKTEQLMQNEILLKDMQRHYYDALLEREEDTRKYRHDMMNHLMLLNNLAEDGEWSSLKEYLAKLQGEMECIHKKCYVTGNKMLDILTNYYISLLPETVSVKVSGRATIVIDEMRLCTIYSNLLQNAVEELLRIQGDKASLLEISFQKGEKFFRIVIKNSLSEQQTDVAELETKKTDKRNHGIGLQNVRRAVETIGGRLEIKKKNDYFEAVVDLSVDNC